ncbi:hypothetical protein GCM10010521_19510 [Streptomyces rameus]|uniref:Uncharacterized protein n=1 Tax=Streptomyces rameus TaxID=68261 RepID=A0ABP6N2H7_9ACTN
MRTHRPWPARTHRRRLAFFNGALPGGGVLLGEKVRIVLEIEATLQPEGEAAHG